MRLLFVPLCLLVAGSARVCSSEEKSNASAVASADVSAETKGATAATAASSAAQGALRAPRIGGSVASAGDLSVELALHEGGRLEALVSDAQGQLVSDAKVSAAVQTVAGANQTVDLGFVAARERFEGQAKAGVEFAPGPVTLSLDVGGKPRTCKLDVGVVMKLPKVGGQMLSAGDFSAEILAHRAGEIQAFVHNPAGADVHGEAGVHFSAKCQAKGGAMEVIPLHFDAPHACFLGKARAGVELAPGPFEFVAEAKIGGGVGRLEQLALTVDTAHGGQIVTVGNYALELVANGNELSAFAFDAAGNAHATGDLDVKLGIGTGHASTSALRWDAPCLCYKGTFAATQNLSLEPIRVSLLAAGKAFVGGVASLQGAARANLHGSANAKLAAPSLEANGKLSAGSKLGAGAAAKLDPKLDAKASANLVKSLGAAVKVTPPQVSVSTKSNATGGAKAGAGAKASAGFSFGAK